MINPARLNKLAPKKQSMYGAQEMQASTEMTKVNYLDGGSTTMDSLVSVTKRMYVLLPESFGLSNKKKLHKFLGVSTTQLHWQQVGVFTAGAATTKVSAV